MPSKVTFINKHKTADNITGMVRRAIIDADALPEDAMRLELLAKRLGALGADDTARFFDELFKDTGNASAAIKLKSALVNPEGLKRALGEEKYNGVFTASIKLRLRKVSCLFSDLPPFKKGLVGYDKEEEIKMEHMPLGIRRALSKKSVKDTIDRLLSDPDPIVITNILNNPRTTEREVLKIASKRPNSPRILNALANHKKWSKRYAIIKAIAMNPYSLPRVSVALLEFLLSQDLMEVLDDNGLHPQVRINAKEILEQKK